MEGQNTVTSPEECVSDLNYPPPQSSKSAGRNSGSIFSLLEQEVQVRHQEFTYSAPSPMPDYLSIKKNSKRRKIKLVPRTEIPSEESAGAPEHVLKPLNPVAGVSSGSNEVIGQGELCHPTELEGNTMKTASEKEEEKKRKLKATGAYIKEVRAFLNFLMIKMIGHLAVSDYVTLFCSQAK